MIRFAVTPVIIGSILLSTAPAAAQEPSPGSAAEPKPSWELTVDWLREEAGRFSADLETAHAALLARAKEAGATALLERLEPEPPKPRQYGYGVIPKVTADGPVQKVVPSKQEYSLEKTSVAYSAYLRDAALLARRAKGPQEARSLDALVAEFERLRNKLRNMESHISYHAHWQDSTGQYRAFFERRNEILALVREWNDLRDREEGAVRAAELQREFLNALAPFHATPGLVLEEREDGSRVLPVRVVTDIEDAAFLDEFRAAIREAYVDSEAAIARRFLVRLTLEFISPDALYPQGAPAYAEKIDAKNHIGRFPEGALVLTTGVPSMHAFTGRSLQLGPAPVTRRTLAHEFGHLLGFDDAYLRAYEGDPQGRFGCVFIEWTGLVDDLMGSNAYGQVTTGMIDQLIEAYTPRATAGPSAEMRAPPARTDR